MVMPCASVKAGAKDSSVNAAASKLAALENATLSIDPVSELS